MLTLSSCAERAAAAAAACRRGRRRGVRYGRGVAMFGGAQVTVFC
jgi:hypothetical protein